MAKGPALEELTRAYFARQGFLALRSVPIQFEDEDVTDIDVWLYGLQGAGIRTRVLVDIKDKRSPRAFERVMWARGAQLAFGCDRAVVVTTDSSPKVKRFAQSHKVTLITSDFLRQFSGDVNQASRLSLEDFIYTIQSYPEHKQDGDWIRQVSSAKSALTSLAPYQAFNKIMISFRFFAERAATRPQHREQALRGAYLCASLACVALDAALERLIFEAPQERYDLLYGGVAYGDVGDGRVRHSIHTVLSVIARSLDNGRVIARQASDAIDRMFAGLRADIIAEFFSREQNASYLFNAARELEARAHMRSRADLISVGMEAKAIVGIFADFASVKRTALFSPSFVTSEAFPAVGPAPADAGPQAGLPYLATETDVEDSTAPRDDNSDPNPRLL